MVVFFGGTDTIGMTEAVMDLVLMATRLIGCFLGMFLLSVYWAKVRPEKRDILRIYPEHEFSLKPAFSKNSESQKLSAIAIR